MAAMNETPAWSSTVPKVNRGVPRIGSNPTVITMRPITPEISPLIRETWAKLQMTDMAKKIRAKSSVA